MAVNVGSVFMSAKLDDGAFRKGIYSVWGASERIFTNVGEMKDEAFDSRPALNFARAAGEAFGVLAVSASQGAAEAAEIMRMQFSAVTTFLRNTFLRDWNSAWNMVGAGFNGVWRGIANFFVGTMNTMVDGINSVLRGLNRINVDIPAWMGGGGFGFNIPLVNRIPMLARGGIVSLPTLAMVGERGREAVLPLENNTGWMDELAYKLSMSMAQSGGSGGGVVSLNIDGVSFAEAVIDDFKDVANRRGIVF